jgi:N6-adenosine-specific RNA methylase IME4/ParB-like chromosome segregation protein Spo0J
MGTRMTTPNPTPTPAVELRLTTALRAHEQANRLPAGDADAYRSFKADIARRGVQVPLEISADNVVLDGHQRLRAASELQLEQLPVRMIAPPDELEYMYKAALERKHLTASQRAALAVELEEHQQLSEHAHQRQLANLRQNTEVAALPPRGEKTREITARQAGCSARTIQDAHTVRQADPELFERIKNGKLAADLAARKVRRAQRDRQIPPGPPLPDEPADLIYGDPAWQMGNPDSPHAPEQHYPTMPLEEIKALQIPAAEHAILFLWAVNSLLPEALQVIEAWGFEYLTNIAWIKPSIGPGRWTRSRHELLLIARRGNHPAPDSEDLPDSVIEAPRGRHSEKPARFYELIERMYPQARKLELFARGTPRPGWAAWGNQVEQP